ncbi:GntR family transcriptional regulator [Bacteroidota bacterium]
MEPIHQPDLSQQVYKRIKEMILSGELKPGEKLTQEHIAFQLGISRMPLHKAFVKLEEEFLVESIPRRGIFIRKPDLKEIIDAFECREGLEGIAARRAVEHITDEDIQKMEQLFEPFYTQSVIDQLAYQKADQEFHEMVIALGGNTIMQKLNRIGNVLIRTYPKGIILPLSESLDDHKKIIQAFRERDKELSEDLIRLHSRKAVEILNLELKEESKNE